MRRLVPAGSFVWLVVHDLRLNWRRFADLFGGGLGSRALVIAAAGLLVLHALAWPAVAFIAPFVAGDSPESRLLIGGGLVAIACWMFAQGLFAATRTLYDRGDLDLLYGSPVSPRRILAAKATAIALSSLGSVAMLTLPVANMGALRLGPHWLAVYPTLAAVALIATGLAVGTVIGLFTLVGPRRARFVAHMTGALVGGGFVLVAQVIAMLPERMRSAVLAVLIPDARLSDSAAPGLIWLPVDALLGDAGAMLVLLAAGCGVFAASAVLGRRFAEASLAAVGTPSLSGHGRAARPIRFRGGVARSLRIKEWRLLLRDPSLFTQLALQIVYTIPLAVVLVRSDALPIAIALTPAIVVITSQVAASLAWIAVSGEDAPELIASAPVEPKAVDVAKLSAIALPVLAVAAIPVAGLALTSPREAFLAFAFATGASAMTGLLNLWHPMPGNRRGMLRRHAQSKLVGLLEHVLAILWAIAAVLALLGSSLWIGALLLTVPVLFYESAVRALSGRRPQTPVESSLAAP